MSKKIRQIRVGPPIRDRDRGAMLCPCCGESTLRAERVNVETRRDRIEIIFNCVCCDHRTYTLVIEEDRRREMRDGSVIYWE